MHILEASEKACAVQNKILICHLSTSTMLNQGASIWRRYALIFTDDRQLFPS